MPVLRRKIDKRNPESRTDIRNSAATQSEIDGTTPGEPPPNTCQPIPLGVVV
jgi:hypothetical protein